MGGVWVFSGALGEGGGKFICRGVAMKAKLNVLVGTSQVYAILGVVRNCLLLVPSHWGKFFYSVRVGQLSFCAKKLLLPLGLPPHAGKDCEFWRHTTTYVGK